MAMLSLSRSLELSARYPTNLISPSAVKRDLDNYHAQLERRQETLFTPYADDILIDLCEYDEVDQQYCWQTLTSLADLKQTLSTEGANLRQDPCSTFIFWHAPNSRARLRLTKEMAYEALTFFQVKPFFLDFLFLFGSKKYEQGSHFSRFRHSPTLSQKEIDKPIPDVGRSGVALEICYNLQGVEHDPDSPGRPWSIRHTVVYHRLDLTNGSCIWLIVKGNEEMKKRVEKLKQGHETAWQTASDGLYNSLSVHEMISSWSAENWRWYLDFLEERLNEVTRPAIQEEVRGKVSVGLSPHSLSRPKTKANRALRLRSIACGQWMAWVARRLIQSKYSQDVPNGMEMDTCGLQEPPEPSDAMGADGPGFMFVDLQKVQRVEEKVNEALLVVEGNMKTMARLRDYYQNIPKLKDMPANIKDSELTTDIARFSERVELLESDMAMHQTRGKWLLRLVADRKTLLTDILNYNNSEISKNLAISTETMTRHMKDLTSRTTQETVMMRVISIVTVLFLPGTFISTLMSTDIIQFPNAQGDLMTGKFSGAALQLYLAFTLPLTAITLAGWWAFYLCVKRKAEDRSMA